tara:strand:+ start:94 stop:564 length:471 start_codon:yes stop_codon:yes gene_type:complete
MIDLVWFNDFICVHRNGDVERIIGGRCGQGKAGDLVLIPNTAEKNGYNRVKINGKMILRHRLVAHCFQNLDLADRKAQVDHIDRNKINNSNENLRIVTCQQNGFNRGAKGCYYVKTNDNWQAQITIDGKFIYLGKFPTEAEAHEAYLDAKLIHHVI